MTNSVGRSHLGAYWIQPALIFQTTWLEGLIMSVTGPHLGVQAAGPSGQDCSLNRAIRAASKAFGELMCFLRDRVAATWCRRAPRRAEKRCSKQLIYGTACGTWSTSRTDVALSWTMTYACIPQAWQLATGKDSLHLARLRCRPTQDHCCTPLS